MIYAYFAAVESKKGMQLPANVTETDVEGAASPWQFCARCMDTGYFTGKAGSEACPACDGDPEHYGRLPRVRRALQPSLIGICHVWIRNVTILGYSVSPNLFIPAGTIGDMEVIEIAEDGRVVRARFHPGGEGHGYGLVTWPLWVQS